MGASDSSLLSCAALSISVPGRQLVDKLDLTLRRGELVAVLGQNGAGKSLTLMTLAGLRRSDGGVVSLFDADIAHVKRQSVAQRLALLPQVIDDIFPATVLDTVLIGRHPHIGRLRWESAEDHTVASASLRSMGLEELSNRDVLTLSGGERRRLAIAQVLAQSPDVYLLDEPSNHLDPQHQIETMRVFRRAVDAGAGVIAALHDINLAVRFADRCLLLFGDGRWELGRPQDVLTEGRLSELYATTMESVRWRSHELFIATSDHPAS